MGCEYNDCLYFSKNCYMCFYSDNFENCLYCYEGNKNKFCSDCSTCFFCELCFECIDCTGCYNSNFSQDCRRVSDSSFCYDCIGCSECFGCAGLRQQKFCLFNEKLSREEYKARVSSWMLKSYEEIFDEFEKIRRGVPHQHAMMYRTEDSTGNHLINAQRCFNCYNSSDLQDCGHIYLLYAVYGERNLDSWNCTMNVDLEQCHEVIQTGKGYNSSFCYYCEVVRDCDYCFQVFNSRNCFGCVSINHGEYMILNQKYEPEDWARKKVEIIAEMKVSGEWGEWPFPEGEKVDTD